MLIHERSIARAQWEPVYRYLTRRVQSKWARFVTTVEGSRIWMVQGTGVGTRIFYVILGETVFGPRPIAWLMLRQHPGWWAWVVEHLWVFPKERGAGLATKLYSAAINHDKLMVASGKTHTRHSRALWEKFIRQKRFNIWAHDFSDFDRTGDIFWDDENSEIFSVLPVYAKAVTNGKLNHNNVRLVAMSKRCS